MQHQGAIFRALSTAERGRSHARVQGAQVIMQRVQVLEEVTWGGAQHLEDLVVARVLAELEERFAEELQDRVGRNLWNVCDKESVLYVSFSYLCWTLVGLFELCSIESC